MLLLSGRMARDFDSEKIAARWITSGRIYMVRTGCGLLGNISSTKSGGVFYPHLEDDIL